MVLRKNISSVYFFKEGREFFFSIEFQLRALDLERALKSLFASFGPLDGCVIVKIDNSVISTRREKRDYRLARDKTNERREKGGERGSTRKRNGSGKE